MQIKNFSLTLLSTLAAVSVAGAQIITLPTPPPTPSPGQQPPPSSGPGSRSYYPTKTYAGSQCHDISSKFYTGTYEYFGGYFNDSNYYYDVICPLVNDNDPYQKYIWSDVLVSDQSKDDDFICSLKKSTPVRGGWAEYSGGRVNSRGAKPDVQTLKLKPVPGGYTPDSHLYITCRVPGYSLLGNYSQYTGRYDYYQRNYNVYTYKYLDGHDYDASYYNEENYSSYSGERY
jgi:hypothetical protein